MAKRKDGLWQIEYRYEEFGQKKRKCFYGKTRSEALQKRDEFIRLGNTDNYTFRDAFNEYKKTEEVRTNNSAFATKCKRIEAFTEIMDVKLTEITPKQISLGLNRLIIKNPYTNKPTAKRTLTRYLAAVSNVFEFAESNRLTTYNPTKYVKVPVNAPKKDREGLTADEYNCILDNPDKRFLAAKLIILCGFRRGELAALQWRDVDIDNSVIHITKSYDYKGGKIKPPKSVSGVRDVPIPNRLKLLLRGIKKADGYAYVINNRGKMLTEGDWHTLNRYISKQSGVQFGWHQLRHTYASILYDADVDVLTAQKLLGHADVKVTLGIYTHLSENKQRISSQKLDAFLG